MIDTRSEDIVSSNNIWPHIIWRTLAIGAFVSSAWFAATAERWALPDPADYAYSDPGSRHLASMGLRRNLAASPEAFKLVDTISDVPSQVPDSSQPDAPSTVTVDVSSVDPDSRLRPLSELTFTREPATLLALAKLPDRLPSSIVDIDSQTIQLETEPSAAPLTSSFPIFSPRQIEEPPTGRANTISPVPTFRPDRQRNSLLSTTVPQVVRSGAAATGTPSTSPSLTPSDFGVIGIFVAGPNVRATLQLPDGSFRRVREGEVVQGWRVSRIREESVTLSRGGVSRNLRLPQ